ncbi:MAG TPA: hypothetical protein VFK79_04840 [Xanthobacteraceae bacterium]|nr:hypothetical protein [Xanthobacteraceae bacterium]
MGISIVSEARQTAWAQHFGSVAGAMDFVRRIAGRLSALAALTTALAWPALADDTAALPRLFTHQSYVEDVLRKSTLQIDDTKAVFAFVLGSLPDRVKVYPTENYYYFRFVHNSTPYAGNIRLATENRDQGLVHFAFSADFAEWKGEDAVHYQLLGAKDGVTVEKLEPLLYRVSYGPKTVVFELNNLSTVAPPASLLAADERYIGPVFDDSAVRFFLVYNTKLKLFHYILDESALTDTFVRTTASDRIVIGKRTGMAFYRDHRIERKILIGIFEGNARVNNYFDGPFDQLPDNFIQGESLRSALLEVAPELKGRIDRFGASPDGQTRFMISPYLHYRDEEDLLIFHDCAENKELAAELYYACFLVEPEYLYDTDEKQMESTPVPKPKSKPKPAPAKKKTTAQKK